MKAELKPLEGKYYGTKINIVDDNGTKARMEIWDNGDYIPSKRELESSGYTGQQWEENSLVDDGWDEGKQPIREIGLISDSHFESKQTYEFALKIINKINL